jgi:hypothetical protein
MDRIIHYLITNKKSFYVQGVKEGTFNIYIGVIYDEKYIIFETDDEGGANIINLPVKKYLDKIAITTIYTTFEYDDTIIIKYYFYKDGQSLLGNDPKVTKEKHRLIDEIFKTYYKEMYFLKELNNVLPEVINRLKGQLQKLNINESRNTRLKNNLVDITSSVTELNKFGNNNNIENEFENALMDPLNSGAFEQQFVMELKRFRDYKFPRYIKQLKDKIEDYISQIKELNLDIDTSDIHTLYNNLNNLIEELDIKNVSIEMSNSDLEDQLKRMLLIKRELLKKGQRFGTISDPISLDLEYLLKLKCC